MNEISPKVSIVLPTYNGAKYIRQSIESCLNQTYKNIELIIVDDCSIDETPGIIGSYKDERIKYIQHETNKGLPHALNTGFAEATGEYFSWTSDDNYYDNNAIEKMIFFLKKNEKCNFVYCDFYRFKDENPTNLIIVKLPQVLSLNSQNDVGACFLYSKTVKETIGDYDSDAFLAEDYDYWIRVSKTFSMFHLDKPLYFYREHSKSLSLSRFNEVRVVNVLIRIKNKVISVDKATDFLVDLIERKYVRYTKINKKINKIRFWRKINNILKDFEKRKLGYMETKLDLINIVKGNL